MDAKRVERDRRRNSWCLLGQIRIYVCSFSSDVHNKCRKQVWYYPFHVEFYNSISLANHPLSKMKLAPSVAHDRLATLSSSEIVNAANYPAPNMFPNKKPFLQLSHFLCGSQKSARCAIVPIFMKHYIFKRPSTFYSMLFNAVLCWLSYFGFCVLNEKKIEYETMRGNCDKLHSVRGEVVKDATNVLVCY